MILANQKVVETWKLILAVLSDHQEDWPAGRALAAGSCLHHPKWLYRLEVTNDSLVGGFNLFEKYARQNGNLPQIGVNIKNI